MFEAFFADRGSKPSPQHVLAGIDVGKNFEPGMATWPPIVAGYALGERMSRLDDSTR